MEKGKTVPAEKALWHQCWDEIFGILQKKKKKHMVKIDPKSKKKIIYGQDLKVESLERNFKQWCQNDPNFEYSGGNLFPPKKPPAESHK